MIATSGTTLAAASPLVLAACGTVAEEDEEVSEARQVELLNEVLPQQLAVVTAAKQAAKAPPEEAKDSIDDLVTVREKSADALEREISDLGGDPDGTAADPIGAESAVEGLARQLEASIAASLAPLGELPPEHRQDVHRAIVEDAAVLATIRSTLGEEPSPDAFVMGPPEKEAET